MYFKGNCPFKYSYKDDEPVLIAHLLQTERSCTNAVTRCRVSTVLHCGLELLQILFL